MSVAYAGVPGAFSHEACLRFLPDQEPLARSGFAEVAAAVQEGSASFGMLPLENNQAGEVEDAQALLGGLALLGEHWLPVRLHLLALPGVTLREIEVAVSHPVALRQCGGTLARLGLRTEVAANTALAAKLLDRRTAAALASSAAAEAYGLSVLVPNVHDRPDNATRFGIVARPGT